MAETLRHRGPNDEGSWVDEHQRIALGHRRLSVLDTSSYGHQPMVSSTGRYVIAFNGEIYNHLTIRDQLTSSSAGPIWRGHSDTETLITAIEQWGLKETLQKTVGMFAFALWDKRDRSLALARDRFGEKPLYYGWANGSFIFGSELKALRMFPGFSNPVCVDALSAYLRFAYVPTPRSIYQGVYKLEPGCLLKLTGQPPSSHPAVPLTPGHSYQNIELVRWFSMSRLIDGAKNDVPMSKADGIERLEQTLAQAVEIQTVADVPLGAFLSGGVDSSTIVALMQYRCTARIKTFTIGFDENGFDESPYARAVAKHLGTDHNEMRVSSSMAQDVIPSLPLIYDEPFGDSSQIPTYLVSKAARQKVTVALSGDGGDELFGGYNRYFWGPRLWNRLAWLPLSTRKALGRTLRFIPIDAWNLLSKPLSISFLGEKAHRLGTRLNSVTSLNELYWSLVSEWDPTTIVKAKTRVTRSDLETINAIPHDINPVEKMMLMDTLTYLSGDILCKVDRAAMSCSLETRAPFLDHRVVKAAWSLPFEMKISGNAGKWALRQVLYKYVPRDLIERPKAGFAVPIGQWLRGPLREWAECLLSESRLRQEGYFYSEPIRKLWVEHLKGKADHTSRLWIILMFQAWLEKEVNRP